jgi:hypothetical protein
LERRTLALAARVHWWHLRWDDCAAAGTAALALAEAAGDEQTELYARVFLVRDAASAGHLADARVHATRALALAERLRERYWLATAHVNCLWLAYLEGDWDSARQHSDAGLAFQPRDARNLGHRGLLEHELGNAAESAAYLDRLRATMRATEPGSTVEHAEAAAVLALVSRGAADAGQLAEGEAAARTVLAAPVRLPIFDLCARVALAIVACEQRDRAAAHEQYLALESHAGTLLVLLGVSADRVLGLLAETMGELTASVERLEAARNFCERSGYAPEATRATFDLAGVLTSRAAPGDAARAGTLRREARAAAGQLGLRALALS